MCDLGINAENYNPNILYIFKQKFTHDCNVPAHSHEHISLMYILSGSCEYKIGNSIYHIKKGDHIICNPEVTHEKLLKPGEELVEFQVAFTNISIRNLPKNYLIPKDKYPVINRTKYDYELSRCYNDLIQEQEKNEPGIDLIAKSIVMKIIALYLKAACDEISTVGESHRENSSIGIEPYDKAKIVNTIISFINENYMKDISLDKISKSTYLSPVYVSKIFKEETGDSPINYLIKVRLSKAMEILTEDNTSIKSVAKSVGYHDAYYFSRLFKKYYGHPPSKLLKDLSQV